MVLSRGIVGLTCRPIMRCTTGLRPKLRSLSHAANTTSMSKQRYPSCVQIVEVGPRDGLQNEAVIVSVPDKIRLIQMLAAAGCTKIEAASFVSPKMVPAMSNSLDVMQGLSNLRQERASSLTLSGLVPNTKYLQQAMEANMDEVAIFVSASETFSQKVRSQNVLSSTRERNKRRMDQRLALKRTLIAV
jgi:hydroxymethylglutaryl-CoA lyase